MRKLRGILTGGALVVVGCGVASASIIYNYQSTTLITSGPNTGDYDWQYIAQLSADEELSSSATDFAVVYDFQGAKSASYSSVFAGITPTTVIEDTTTPPHNQSVSDSPTIENVVTNIAGTVAPSTLTNLYTINIVSTSGLLGTDAYQSAQALKLSNDTVSGNTVEVQAPGILPGIPEPAPMALMGGGLLVLGLIGKRFKKQ